MIAEIQKILAEETRATLFAEFDALKEDLIKKHKELNMEASGNWISKLDVYQSELKTALLGEKYTEQLAYGRKGGSLPPVERIRQWTIDKGIAQQLRDEAQVTSLAWAIAKKIERDGTKYFQDGGTDLVSSVITPERMQKIINLVGKEVAIATAPVFTNYFKTVKNG